MSSNPDDSLAMFGASGDAGPSRSRDDLGRSEGRSRRSFLKSAAVASAVPATVLAGSSTGLAAASTATLPYQNDANWIKNHIQNILNNENNHLQGLLAELGVFARPQPTFSIPAPTTLKQFVQMGSMFCSTGAGAYLGAAPYIDNPVILTQAGSIGQVELTQSGFLNSLLDLPFTAGGSPFAVPLTLAQVTAMAGPFIASLNGGPPISFSTTEKSLENDIAILNTALVLEYLEHQFYNTYFPKFFS